MGVVGRTRVAVRRRKKVNSYGAAAVGARFIAPFIQPNGLDKSNPYTPLNRRAVGRTRVAVRRKKKINSYGAPQAGAPYCAGIGQCAYAKSTICFTVEDTNKPALSTTVGARFIAPFIQPNGFDKSNPYAPLNRDAVTVIVGWRKHSLPTVC
jgi:hypothetical protein